jgi:hypothetical protein
MEPATQTKRHSGLAGAGRGSIVREFSDSARMFLGWMDLVFVPLPSGAGSLSAMCSWWERRPSLRRLGVTVEIEYQIERCDAREVDISLFQDFQRILNAEYCRGRGFDCQPKISIRLGTCNGSPVPGFKPLKSELCDARGRRLRRQGRVGEGVNWFRREISRDISQPAVTSGNSFSQIMFANSSALGHGARYTSSKSLGLLRLNACSRQTL